MVKLVENTEETVHAKKLLDELRSEVREAPVSYTHLDVYKRQGQVNIYRINDFFIVVAY